jgi:hypothetical protein
MGYSDRAPMKVGGGSQEQRVLKIGRGVSEAGVHTPWDRTDATRYLCASAYLYRPFRNYVIQTFVEDKHQALAASYGIDPVIILKHCLVARRINRTRDILLTIPVLLALFGLLASIIPGVGLLIAPVLVFLAAVAAFIIIAWEQWKIEFQIVRNNFTKKRFEPGVSSHAFSGEEEQVFREVESAQKSNTMIYAAFSPFVGSGNNIGSWSVSVDLNKGKEDVGGYLQPKSFHIKELYEEVTRTLRALEFPNCSIEDKVCISGLDIRGDEKFLPDLMGRPRTRIEPSAIDEYVTHPSLQARHYQTFRVVDWSGELILTAFLRAAKTGHNLFIEASYCMLVPVDEGYRAVDSMNPAPGWRDWLRLFATSATKTIFIWLAWPFYILKLISHPLNHWSHEREVRRMIRENPAFNHGAVTSLRESTCTSNLYRRYFQKLDKEMYMKTLESQILDCIVDFLDAHNVDTSDLKEAQTKITNSGIIVAGGSSVEANTLAVGRGSTAVGPESQAQGAIKFIKGLGRRVAGGREH